MLGSVCLCHTTLNVHAKQEKNSSHYEIHLVFKCISYRLILLYCNISQQCLQTASQSNIIHHNRAPEHNLKSVNKELQTAAISPTSRFILIT